MEKIITDFQNETEKRRLVEIGEADFEARLDTAVGEIVSRDALRIVTLSGPTCSGKTTASAKLETELRQHGHRVHVISIDDFYLNRELLLSRAAQLGKRPDFDSEETIDFDALRSTVEQIFCAQAVSVPQFEFASGSRTGWRRIDTREGDVFLFEGIQAVYPLVTSLLREHSFTSIYISVEKDAACEGAFFPREDIRFLRRLVRDARFRASSPEFTFHLWETVRENELRNILPYADGCDVRICSYLPYELHMIRPFAEELLQQIKEGSEYREKASQLLEMLSHIPQISDRYLPPNSLFREFLG